MEETFTTDVIQDTEGLLILIFVSNHLATSRILCSILKNLQRKYDSDFSLALVDIDQKPSLKEQFAVEVIPSTFFFLNGEKKDYFVGTLPEKMIRQKIESHL